MPDTPKASPGASGAPRMVLPPPAPQSEIEGMRAGYANQEVVPEPGITPYSANGHPEPTRKDGTTARHPISKRYTNK